MSRRRNTPAAGRAGANPKLLPVGILLSIGMLLAPGCARDFTAADRYLGQGAPPALPELFAPGIVNSGLLTRDLALSPDGREAYFCQVAAGYRQAVICRVHWRDGRWSEPEVAPFSGATQWIDLEPAISPDGQRFFFYSNRPHPDGGDDPQDLWMMDRTDGGWSAPRPVGEPVNTPAPEFFPSVDRAGTLYFCRADPETRIHTLFRAPRVGDGYGAPEKLPATLNAGRNRFNAWIGADGDRIVVPVAGHPGNRGAVDYWLGERDASGAWGEMRHLGPRINDGSGQSWSPSLSTDGEAFFFMSGRTAGGEDPVWPQSWSLLQARHRAPGQGRAGVWWVSGRALDATDPSAAADDGASGDDGETVAPALELAAGPGFPRLEGDLLGQGDPPAAPAPFARGVVSTGLTERDLVFTPDGERACFGVMDLGLVTLLETRRADGVWTEPRTAGFHTDPDFACFEPTFSADGESVVFLSNRAAPGQVQGRGWANQNLFTSRRTNAGWSEPVALPAPVTTDAAEYFPCLAHDGTLYFSREDSTGHPRLWNAEPEGDGYSEPVRLPATVNIGTDTYNAFVAPDESLIIVCVAGHPDNLGPADYWISFRGTDGEWLPAVNLGEPFNGEGLRAASASLSPDGRALFFSTTRPDPDLDPLPERWTLAEFRERQESHGTGSSDLWWVEADVLARFR